MAYINAATAGNFARLLVKITDDDSSLPTVTNFVTAGVSDYEVDNDVIDTPALQDITITNNANTFRWRQLDILSERVISTVSTNSIAGNLVLDPDTFFGEGGTDAPGKGIFNISNEKVQVDFFIAFEGLSAGDRFLMGRGYITNLAPAVSADAPVWVSPFTVEVDGDYTTGVLAPINGGNGGNGNND